MTQRLNKKYVISRKILVLGSLILIPLVLLFIYIINGFVQNKISDELFTALGYEEGDKMQIVSKSNIVDFTFTPTITSYTKATDDNNGTIVFTYLYKNDKDGVVSNVSTKICAGDYWANYVSSATSKTRASIGNSVTDTSIKLTLAKNNKNGFGITTNVNTKPDLYIRLSYTCEEDNGDLSKKDFVVKYSFDEMWTSSSAINE